MIKQLVNSEVSIASKIWTVWQASYAVEAALIQATNFPPLKRSIEDFTTSNTKFFGFWEDSELAAVIEVKVEKDYVHIQSLVVHPSHFRKGIAQKLLDFTFSTLETRTYTVETGLANTPASALYLKNGFIEVKQWDTDHGIRKIGFEKISS